MSRHKTNHVNMNGYVFGLGFNVFILLLFIKALTSNASNVKKFGIIKY